mmetsp:Transcript_10838/g.15970  ORF Transcript_10838/g.15970 Transcript_10838/m.15970 type:complete len:204 (+) Transcript_10838:670-1281(+)
MLLRVSRIDVITETGVSDCNNSTPTMYERQQDSVAVTASSKCATSFHPTFCESLDRFSRIISSSSKALVARSMSSFNSSDSPLPAFLCRRRICFRDTLCARASFMPNRAQSHRQAWVSCSIISLLDSKSCFKALSLTDVSTRSLFSSETEIFCSSSSMSCILFISRICISSSRSSSANFKIFSSISSTSISVKSPFSGESSCN